MQSAAYIIYGQLSKIFSLCVALHNLFAFVMASKFLSPRNFILQPFWAMRFAQMMPDIFKHLLQEVKC